jgi:hypothetical protein
MAPLVAVNGTLYGTTSSGGSGSSCGAGCGIVFKLITSGEDILHNFQGGADGTTSKGGGSDDEGTVFSVTP